MQHWSLVTSWRMAFFDLLVIYVVLVDGFEAMPLPRHVTRPYRPVRLEAAAQSSDITLLGGVRRIYLPDGSAATTGKSHTKHGRTAPALRATLVAMSGCTHLNQVRDVRPGTDGCQECLEQGGWWVHLRMCLTCGHVGCCDSSPSRHATQHHHETKHPLVRSLEPGEDWAWCYVDDVILERA